MTVKPIASNGIAGNFAGCKIFYTTEARELFNFQGVALFQINEPGYFSFSCWTSYHNPRGRLVAIFHIKWKGGRK